MAPRWHSAAPRGAQGIPKTAPRGAPKQERSENGPKIWSQDCMLELPNGEGRGRARIARPP
eukprot:7242624-Pyramimonas_sp.AAC.1